MQIDLQEPMKITSIIANGKTLKFNREGNAYFIELKKKQKKNVLILPKEISKDLMLSLRLVQITLVDILSIISVQFQIL